MKVVKTSTDALDPCGISGIAGSLGDDLGDSRVVLLVNLPGARLSTRMSELFVSDLGQATARGGSPLSPELQR